ncbi:MAG: hypothetical protein ACTSX2_05460 [Candidatus Thorarchaeota archaeon]
MSEENGVSYTIRKRYDIEALGEDGVKVFQFFIDHPSDAIHINRLSKELCLDVRRVLEIVNLLVADDILNRHGHAWTLNRKMFLPTFDPILRTKVLMAIHDFEEEHGRGPSIEELRQCIGTKELKPLTLAESIISLENMALVCRKVDIADNDDLIEIVVIPEESKDLVKELITNMRIRRKDFPLNNFMQEMKSKMRSKDAEYGDSWKICDIDFLRGRLNDEHIEWLDIKGDAGEAEELVDIANLCMMLWIRLRMERSSNFTKMVEMVANDPDFKTKASNIAKDGLFDEDQVDMDTTIKGGS